MAVAVGRLQQTHLLRMLDFSGSCQCEAAPGLLLGLMSSWTTCHPLNTPQRNIEPTSILMFLSTVHLRNPQPNTFVCCKYRGFACHPLNICDLHPTECSAVFRCHLEFHDRAHHTCEFGS